MKIGIPIRITPHLWDYGMNASQTAFLAFLFERELARLRGDRKIPVNRYDAETIVENTPSISMNLAMYYRYRKTLIKKRLLLPFTDRGGNGQFRLNESEFSKWRASIEFEIDGRVLDKLN